MNQKLDCAAFVGVDWADQEHAVCVLPAEGGPAQHCLVKQQPEAIAAWVAGLRQQFGGRPIVVCLEQSRGGLIYALMAYEFLVLCPINPSQLAAYRAALHPSGAKDDPTDAELLASFVRDHGDRVRVWLPDDEVTRGLRLLSEQRRTWVEQRVALEHQLRQRLKETYPQALELIVGDLHSEYMLAFLAKFPTLKELQRASPRQLAKWLRLPRRRPDDLPAEQLQTMRIAAIRQAIPLTKDPAILEHARLVICSVVAQIQSLNRAIVDCEQRIAELFARHPDHDLFASFPGAGTSLAPRLAAAFGTDREKYATALNIQQLSGIAPVTRSSGKKKVVRARWARSKFLHQTFYEFARCSTKYSVWAKAYVEMRRSAGAGYHVIIRALAFKWQRILFRCWQNGECYDEQKYLQRLLVNAPRLARFLRPPEVETP